MILQSLARYYEYLRDRHPERVAPPGWCRRDVAFRLEIGFDGSLKAIIPSAEKRGWSTIVPEQVKRSSGIAANAFCDNSSYFLGIDGKGKPDRAEKCFNASRKLHLSLLQNIESPAAKAVVNFFETWNPANAAEHPLLEAAGEALFVGNMVFSFEGEEVLEDADVRRAWDAANRSGADGGAVMRCLVTGEEAPIARLHPPIKGIADAQPMGASLVGFNSAAFESYGHDGEQGLNAPVSERAAFAYATALNYLLSDPLHHMRLGDTTMVYWAEGEDDDACADIACMMFGGIPPEQRGKGGEDRDEKLHAILRAVSSGLPVGDVDMDAPFYVLGLAPNAARVSVRFFVRDSFGSILSNIAQHYERMDIVHAPHEWDYVYPFQILKEIENPNAKKPSISPSIAGGLIRSILEDLPYPEALFENALLRTRASRDDSDTHTRKVSRGRMAILKAYLIKNRKERITMGLDEERTDVPYVLGRMFAMFEDIQYAANYKPNTSVTLNATVKDKYFNAACATPALIFPTLVALSEAHARKARRDNPGAAVRFDKRMRTYMWCLEDIPESLTQKEQSIFYLGYYHQSQHDIQERTKNKVSVAETEREA